MAGGKMPTYGKRVEARTTLARELGKDAHRERRAGAGLLDDDLAFVVRKGEEAQAHDREQREQLAANRQGVSEQLEARERFDTEQEALRDRLAAVALDLTQDAATRNLAGWLENAAFERFHIRIVRTETPPPATPATPEPPATPTDTRHRVRARDRLSIAQETTQFGRAILEPDRGPIVTMLGRRGFGRERLSALATTAEALVQRLGGRAMLQAAEATRLEAEAVAAQKERWEACRRMIRTAVSGNAELERLWAAC